MSRQFTITVRADRRDTNPVASIRWALKTLGRRFGLTCIDIAEVPPGPAPSTDQDTIVGRRRPRHVDGDDFRIDSPVIAKPQVGLFGTTPPDAFVDGVVSTGGEAAGTPHGTGTGTCGGCGDPEGGLESYSRSP